MATNHQNDTYAIVKTRFVLISHAQSTFPQFRTVGVTPHFESIDRVTPSIQFVSARIGIGRDRCSLLRGAANERVLFADSRVRNDHVGRRVIPSVCTVERL